MKTLNPERLYFIFANEKGRRKIVSLIMQMRVVNKPGPVPPVRTVAIIYLRRVLPRGSSDLTRKVPRAASSLPYSVLLRVGFVKPASRLAAGALLPHLSTLAPPRRGGFRFYDTFPRVTPAGRYPARCPVEPGLSSNAKSISDCLSDSQPIL